MGIKKPGKLLKSLYNQLRRCEQNPELNRRLSLRIQTVENTKKK